MSAVVVDPSNENMATAWNGGDGDHWVRHDATYHRSLGAYHDTLLDAAGIRPADVVLDIGCGSGHTTRDAARRASEGEAVGVDISAPLIANARVLAEQQAVRNVRFEQADAQVHPFPDEGFDVTLSRCGAMFFGDPAAAFANIARAMRPDARLAMLVWQRLEDNEWFGAFAGALLAGRPPLSPPEGAPGPFAMGSPERARPLLEGAGFVDLDFADLRRPMNFGPDAEHAFGFVSTLAFAQAMLQDLDEQTRAAALDTLRSGLEAHRTPEGVCYDSAAWLITGRRSG